jgi:ubiquinone/menaquinone biosynthesis C-methylase UbiE
MEMGEEAFWFNGAKYKILEGKEGVREAYDRMAHEYDRSERLYWTRRMEEGEERIIRKWIKDISSPILDVGCGTGRYATEIAKKGLEVVASDMGLQMLKKTMRKAKKRDVFRRINLVLADGEHLPFKEKTFNGLICTLTFDHFEDCESAAQEFSRVLEKDSLCILSTFNSYTLSDFKRRYNLPADKVPFSTEDLSPVLIYEVGHSAADVEKLFGKYEFETMDVKGCCYWHLLPVPTSWIKHYKTSLDPVFNVSKSLLRYAEIHVTLMKKR